MVSRYSVFGNSFSRGLRVFRGCLFRRYEWYLEELVSRKGAKSTKEESCIVILLCGLYALARNFSIHGGLWVVIDMVALLKKRHAKSDTLLESGF
jgi:hypothetical protein